MAKVYIYRHQAAGMVSKYIFSQPPTAEQHAAIERELFQSFGGSHPKTGEVYWLKLLEQDVLGAEDVPEVPERALSLSSGLAEPSRADFAEVSVRATANVRNPGE